MAWNRIRGQDAAHNTFLTAIERGRLGHSYLLVGPDGVGKRLFSRELAKAFLCEKPPAALTACGVCPSCTQVEAGTHPDVLYLRKPDDKQELPIEKMREFCARVSLKPVRGSRKFGIVEDADDFNEESANAFLKTLEEPPPGLILLLIATDIGRQLPTILSRCQVVRFASLSEADIDAILAERGIADAAKRARLARLARGSAARALLLNDEGIAETRDKLLEGLTSSRASFQPLAELWAKSHDEAGKAAKGTSKEDSKDAGRQSAAQRARASLLLGFIIEMVEDSLKLSLGATVPGLDRAEAARLQAFAERVGPEGLLELLEHCVEADFHVERRVQLILVVESVIEKFTAHRAK